MEEPGADEADKPLLGETEQFRKNARAFLVAVARFAEVTEAREERRALNNPWIAGQVVEN